MQNWKMLAYALNLMKMMKVMQSIPKMLSNKTLRKKFKSKISEPVLHLKKIMPEINQLNHKN